MCGLTIALCTCTSGQVILQSGIVEYAQLLFLQIYEMQTQEEPTMTDFFALLYGIIPTIYSFHPIFYLCGWELIVIDSCQSFLSQALPVKLHCGEVQYSYSSF